MFYSYNTHSGTSEISYYILYTDKLDLRGLIFVITCY